MDSWAGFEEMGGLKAPDLSSAIFRVGVGGGLKCVNVEVPEGWECSVNGGKWTERQVALRDGDTYTVRRRGLPAAASTLPERPA